MSSIIRFFSKEHLLGNLLTIFIILLGIYTVFSAKRDIFPEVNFRRTVITTFLGGASPEEIETSIVNVIEPQLREIDGIKLVQSTASENRAITVIELDADARDLQVTNSDIQKTIDRLEDLPREAEKPIVTAIESGLNPIIEVHVSGDVPPFELREAAQELYDELSLLSDVGQITKMGYLKREFLVEADAKKLAQRQISLNALIQSITQNNISISGGVLSHPDGSETLTRTQSKLKTKDQLLQMVLLTNDAGFETRLSDVSQVHETLSKPDTLYRVDGKEAIILQLAKKANKDAIRLVQLIRQKSLEVKKRLGESIHIGFANDFSIYLSNRLKTLSGSLTVGLLLISLILTFFLPWSVILVVCAGIPVALFATLIVVSALGVSINLLSLLGLIIVLGMLVDDAIVVCENIWRHMEMEPDRTKAIVEGTREVFSPILTSILTTISAFAPMLFMSGIFGAFVFQIPMMVILALIFSLLEAFLIMPAHFSSWVVPFLKKPTNSTPPKKRWFDGPKNFYTKYVSWSLKFRYLLVGVFFLILSTTIPILTKKGNFVLFPKDGVDKFFIELEAPPHTSLKDMSKKLIPIEKEIAKLPSHELKDFTSSIGIIQRDGFDSSSVRNSNYANIRVSLSPNSQRSRSVNEIITQLRSSVKKPKGVTQMKIQADQAGPPQGKAVSIDLMGRDLDELQVISKKIKDTIKYKINGIINMTDSFRPGKKEWQVRPRLKDMALVGLTSTDVGLSVRAAFDGIVASSIRKLDEEIDIRVRLKKNLQQDNVKKQFHSIEVGNRLGQLIPLHEIADFQLTDSVTSIQHVNYRRVINISADVDNQETTALEANKDIKPLVAGILKEHPGYSVRYGGEEQDTRESLQSLYIAFIFAACIIFSLLLLNFKNILQPMIILTSIPMGFTGATYALWLHQRPFSFMAMLGIIALSGVIVNNCIVFTDFVNQRRKLGKKINDSIIEAAEIRIRPIVLTTLTTICGLLPTAYGETCQRLFGFGSGDPFVTPIALTLGWGLAVGAAMTSLFFPSFIRILDDINFILVEFYQSFTQKKPSQ